MRSQQVLECDHGRLDGYWGGCGACSPPEGLEDIMADCRVLARGLYRELHRLQDIPDDWLEKVAKALARSYCHGVSCCAHPPACGTRLPQSWSWCRKYKGHDNGMHEERSGFSHPSERVYRTVVINGVEHYLPHTKLPYEYIVLLAKSEGTPSVTCKNPTSGGGFGMAPNTSVETVDGMIFNVAHTGNA